MSLPGRQTPAMTNIDFFNAPFTGNGAVSGVSKLAISRIKNVLNLNFGYFSIMK